MQEMQQVPVSARGAPDAAAVAQDTGLPLLDAGAVIAAMGMQPARHPRREQLEAIDAHIDALTWHPDDLDKDPRERRQNPAHDESLHENPAVDQSDPDMSWCPQCHAITLLQRQRQAVLSG